MDWISVKDKLPEQDGSYLVYYNNEGICGIWIDDFTINLSNIDSDFEGENRSGWYEYIIDGNEGCYFEEITSITHWMPLPEKPNNA